MIGAGLKKYAKENGMTVSGGYAYGNFRGYTVSMCEGNGWKKITVNTCFSQLEDLTDLTNLLNSRDVMKTYRLSASQVTDGRITVVFQDTVGTMKRIRAFADWFFPELDGCGLTKFGICDVCGQPIGTDGCWQRIDDSVLHVHTHCAEKLTEKIRASEAEERQNAGGSYLTGFVGAFYGALIGAVLWAVVLNLGYIAGVVGLLIAFLAVKGYDLLYGRQGKAKVYIVSACVVAAVIAGNYFAYLWMLYSALREYGTADSLGTLLAMMNTLLVNNAEVQGEFLRNLAVGLLLGVLGAVGIISRTAKSVGGTKISSLK